jgi:large subunit ribosomal protein L10
MPNLVNTLIAAEYAKLFSASEGLLVLTTGGLTVPETEALRAKLAEAGVRLRMVRNSLARRALAEHGYEFPAATFSGNVGVAVGSTEGTVHAAKVLTSPEVRKAGKIKLLGAVFDGAQLSAADAQALAGVPDKLTLRAQFLGVLQGPARSLASLLNALPASMARVLQARVDAQPSAGESSSEAGDSSSEAGEPQPQAGEAAAS